MSRSDSPDERESETDAGSVSRAVNSVEPIEYPIMMFRRNSRPVIFYSDSYLAISLQDSKVHLVLGLTVLLLPGNRVTQGDAPNSSR